MLNMLGCMPRMIFDKICAMHLDYSSIRGDARSNTFW